MIMGIIYKTLFEIKILHEYYLTDPDGKTIFDLENQDDRIRFLLDRKIINSPSVNNDLSVVVSDFLHSLLKNYRLRLIESYSGFKVAVEVRSKQLKDGVTVYQPSISLPEDFNLFFLLINNSSGIDSISNVRLNKSLPAKFYFTNDDNLNKKKFPSLSGVVSDFYSQVNYEQGELASFGANDIREFLNNDSADPWRRINGTGYVNENDRLLVGLNFFYQFDNSDNLNTAQFELRNQSGNLIQRIEIKNIRSARKVSVYFTSDDIIVFPLSTDLNEIVYTLDVSTDNGIYKKYDLIFYNGIDTVLNIWGGVNIKATVKNPDFSLFDKDGFLKTRKRSDGIISGVPVFELRIKSRLVFWRYINNKGKKIILDKDYSEFLKEINGDLITNSPRPLTHNLTLLQRNSDKSFHYFPNPSGDKRITIDDGVQFVDIFVPESDMFPTNNELVI